MPYDKKKPYSCPCCGYWNGDMKYDFYKHKEPLIKDEKIRKAVRAWAEASYLRGAIFDFDDGTMTLRGLKRRASISFDGLDFCEFKHITAEYHTITELCGEEEE